MHAIRLKGVADTDVVAEVTGTPVDRATKTIDSLADVELVKRVETRRLRGRQITTFGRERHQTELAADIDQAASRDQVGAA